MWGKGGGEKGVGAKYRGNGGARRGPFFGNFWTLNFFKKRAEGSKVWGGGKGV